MRPIVPLLWLLLLAAPAAPKPEAKPEIKPGPKLEPKIAELQVSIDGEHVLVSFDLLDAFNQRLLERIGSGLPTELGYELELARDRKRWWDQAVAEATLAVVATYDAVRHEYLVNFKLDDRLIESRIFHELPGLERAMTHFERVPAFALEPQTSRQRMLVKVRADLGSRTLFSFIPLRITTGWAESKKFQPPTLAEP